MGICNSNTFRNNESINSRSPITIPDIPRLDVKIQMIYIIQNWIRLFYHKTTKNNTSFPLDIVELIVDTFLYQQPFDAVQKRKIEDPARYKLLYTQNFTSNETNNKRDPGCSDHVFKIYLVGNRGVGKKSLLSRYVDDVFDDLNIGPEVRPIKVSIDDTVIKLKLIIWDPKIYRLEDHWISRYYKRFDLIIIVYDITSEDSFDSIRDWNNEIQRYAPSYIPKILIGTKKDVVTSGNDQYEFMQFETVKELSTELNILHYVQVSAKTGENVNSAFDYCVRYVHDLQRHEKELFSHFMVDDKLRQIGYFVLIYYIHRLKIETHPLSDNRIQTI